MNRIGGIKRIGMASLLCWLGLLSASGQFYLSGSDPQRLHWDQVQAGRFRVIYPRGMDSLAYEYASKLYAHPDQGDVFRTARSRKARPLPTIPVVLHAYSCEANGFVAQSPSRMEFYTIPGTWSSSLLWSESLCLHEARHAYQMNLGGRRLFRWGHFLLGEFSESLALGLVSSWSPGQIEGDAVMRETLLSKGGRGRQAEFLMPYKAYFLQDVNFSYDKWQFGSLRHYIPNEYALGYLKQSAVRLQADSLPAYASQAAERLYDGLTGRPWRYRGSYRDGYGRSLREMWSFAKTYYTERWQQEEQPQTLPFDEPHYLTPDDRRFLMEDQPVWLDGQLCWIDQKQDLPAYIVTRLKNGNVQRKALLGRINSQVTATPQRLLWTETTPTLRWENSSYSDLRYVDKAGRKAGTLAHRKRWFHPAAEPTGRYIAVVEARPEGGERILILTPKATPSKIKPVEVPAHTEVKYLSWGMDGLYAALVDGRGSRISRVDLDKGRLDDVVPPVRAVIDDLRASGFNLYFSSDVEGSNQVYVYRCKEGGLERITRARFGAFSPMAAPAGKVLYYISYDKEGYRLCDLPLQRGESAWDAFLGSPASRLPDELQPLELAARPDTFRFEPRPYRKWGHLLRFHSWLPFYVDYDNLSAFSLERFTEVFRLGAMVATQNDLGTLSGTLGYSYHRGFHAAHLNATWSGSPVVFSLKASLNDGAAYCIDGLDEKADPVRLTAPRLYGQLTAYLPLKLDRGGWVTRITPSLSAYATNNWVKLDPSYGGSFRQMALQYGLQAYAHQGMTRRDVFPRFGLGGDLRYASLPGRESFIASMSYASAYLFLPGFARNHAFRLKWAMQTQSIGSLTRLYMSGPMELRFGSPEQTYCPGIMKYSLDYGFKVPIDLSIPGFLYVKSYEAVPFAEYYHLVGEPMTSVKQVGGSQKFVNVGMDNTFTFHLLRSTYPFTAGVRTTWCQPFGFHAEALLSMPL